MQLVEQPPQYKSVIPGTEVKVMSKTVGKTPSELAGIVSQVASSGQWLERVRLRTDRRWYERLYYGADHDIWIISWMPGQSTGYHDHGESSGAFVVATGSLEEHRTGCQSDVIESGETRAFGPNYAHDVRNLSSAPAISIHAYSPPLNEMNEYDLDEDQLILRERIRGRVDATEKSHSENPGKTNWGDASNIDEMLSRARARLRRLSPEEAKHAFEQAGAVLVDIRPQAQRAMEGSIPGALVIERNVLEWRLDPTSSARLPLAANHDLFVIVFCSEGYTSSLAAAALQDLGLWRATDITGGFHAWRASGLPVE